MATYAIADTHFGHRNIIKFESEARPFATIEEHDAELVDLWNATVTNRDIVWHLGDVLFGGAAFAILPRLNGTKKLVMGNHDRYPITRYLEYFTKVTSSAQYGGAIMTHIPVHPSQFPRFRANIHGHLHHKAIADPRYINVSVERTGLRPVLIDALLAAVDG